MPRTKDGHTALTWARVDEVVELILLNDRYLQKQRCKELTDVVSERFNLKKRQSVRLILAAREEIKKIGAQNKEEAFLRALRDRDYLFQQAKNPNFIYNKDVVDENGKLLLVANLELALRVAQDREKLLGLYPAETKDVNITQTPRLDLSKWSDEELKAAIALSETESENEHAEDAD